MAEEKEEEVTKMKKEDPEKRSLLLLGGCLGCWGGGDLAVWASGRNVAGLLAGETDDGFILLAVGTAFWRRSRRRGSGTLLKSRSLGSGFGGLGHGFGHLFTLPGKLLK